MQEEALAAEMERIRMEEKRDAKMRQQIRESRFYNMSIYFLTQSVKSFYFRNMTFFLLSKTKHSTELIFTLFIKMYF